MTVILFIAILGALVLAHEAGHFFAAKRAGVKVHEFGIGFPPRLYGKQFGETVYTINLLPFGGFVRIEGEDGSQAAHPTHESFVAKPLSTKLLIVLAGVMINWLIAAALFGIVQTAGTPVPIADDAGGDDPRVTLTSIAEESPAETAGLSVGDSIAAITTGEGMEYVTRVDEVQSILATNAGEEITLLVQRGDETRTVMLTPRINPPEGEGAVGVALLRVATVSYPWYEAPWRGVFLAGSLTISMLESFGDMFRTLIVEQRAVEGLAGPVGIAYLTGEVRSLGTLFLLNFIAILSLNLAILNAIPFPALDGGRAVIAFVERIRGRAISAELLGRVNATGFAVLILLIVAITIRDIRVYVL